MTIVASSTVPAVVTALCADASGELAPGAHRDLTAPTARAGVLFTPGTPEGRRVGPVRAMRPLLRKPLPGGPLPEAARIDRNVPDTPLSAVSKGGPGYGRFRPEAGYQR